MPRHCQGGIETEEHVVKEPCSPKGTDDGTQNNCGTQSNLAGPKEGRYRPISVQGTDWPRLSREPTPE